jgi:hypothetical protein
MHPQLAALAADFDSASHRLDALEQGLTADQWARRPADGGWSAVECIQHLNLTADATLPRVSVAIAQAGPVAPDHHYRRDLWGWVIWRSLRQPGRFKTKTAPAFVPDAGRPLPAILADFRRLQTGHLTCVGEAEGRALDAVRVVSPFNERVRYNAYAALTILAVHQHRHLWQAERAVSSGLASSRR